jgi:hypothetical protein
MSSLLFRLSVMIAAMIAAALVLVVSSLFLFGALYLALLPMTSRPAAALLTGLAGMLLAMMIVLVGRLPSLLRRRRPARRSDRGLSADPAQLIAELGRILGAEASAQAKSHPVQSIVGSLVAGFAVGASPELRAQLGSLLRSWMQAGAAQEP